MFCEELVNKNNDLGAIIENCEKVEEFEIHGNSPYTQKKIRIGAVSLQTLFYKHYRGYTKKY